MKFDKYDIAMARLASRMDDSRPVLSCVHVKDGYLEVADGFVLIRRDLDLEREEQAPTECLIPAKMMAKIQPGQRRSIPSTSINPETHIITTKYVRFDGDPAEHEPTFSFRDFSTQATYPNTDQLFRNSPCSKKTRISFTVGCLKRILNTMPDEAFVTLGINGYTDAVEFTTTNIDRNIHGLIMPANVRKDDLELWLRKNVPEETKLPAPEPTPEPPNIVVN